MQGKQVLQSFPLMSAMASIATWYGMESTGTIVLLSSLKGALRCGWFWHATMASACNYGLACTSRNQSGGSGLQSTQQLSVYTAWAHPLCRLQALQDQAASVYSLGGESPVKRRSKQPKQLGRGGDDEGNGDEYDRDGDASRAGVDTALVEELARYVQGYVMAARTT
jgi:hypothetical protein